MPHVVHRPDKARCALWSTRRALAGLVALAAAGLTVVAAAPPAFAAHGSKVYVGPGPAGGDTGCASPGFTSIQTAVNAARSGSTIVVCAGTYAEQVTVSTPRLNIVTSGTATLQPTAAAVNASDTDTSQPIVALIVVKPGAHNVNISGLAVDGSQIESSVDGCSQDLVGVLYQAGAGGACPGRSRPSPSRTSPRPTRVAAPVWASSSRRAPRARRAPT